MKLYADKEIEVKVEPFSTQSYIIYYREKKRFNLFNPWKCYTYTWKLSITAYDAHQPYLFYCFTDAIDMATKLKEDPSLIDKNEEKRKADFIECEKNYNEHLKSRKTATL